MTVESGGVEGGGDGAADGGGSSTTDGDAPPKKPPSEPPRPATPSAAHHAAGGGRPAETGCKLLCDTDAGDPDDPEDDEILEESPCKRWSKRREKVKQRDVPGIDAAYLAMDNETGNEVVWNEVLFSERKNFRDQEEKIRAVFDNLIRLEHPNLVKFHKYWMDTKSDKPRIIFITEYMSSGSMSRFLQRARSSGSLLNIKAWKNWTRQILSALSYLHSCDPPIVHANLTSTSVFIQQNGLVKIGCVAPKTIHHHVKTFRENIKNVHYLAPEYDHQTETTIQADIYSFGVCALEMATTGALQSGCFNGASTSASTASTGLPSTASTSALLGTVSAAAAAAAAIEKEKTAEPGGVAAPACGISSSTSSSMLPVPAGNGVQPPQSSGAAGGGGGGSCFHMVTEEMVQKAIHSLDQPEQKQFIERCLEHDPARRANVIELLDRLGPPEPDPDDTFDHNQHSQHEDGYITNHHHPHNFVVSAATNTASANVMSVDTNSLPLSITTALTTAPATITKNTATVAPAPVPSITTSNATQTLSSATTTTTTTISSTIATIMTGSLTTTTAVTNNNINGVGNINGMLLQHNTNALGNGGGVAAVTTTTTATDEGYHTNQSIVDGGGGQSALMNTSAFVNAVGGSAFGSSLHGHGHAETAVNGGCGTVVDPANVGIVQLPQNRETRQVVQLHAELLEPDSEGVATKLRVQLQLDDQMNRQLTASLREGDTADSLAADLVQNGFVSEANSSKVCELLTNVMSSRTVQLQQLRGRRRSSAASAEESSLPLVFKEVVNVDGGNGRIVGEKEEAKETTTTRRRASPTHIQQQ